MTAIINRLHNAAIELTEEAQINRQTLPESNTDIISCYLRQVNNQECKHVILGLNYFRQREEEIFAKWRRTALLRYFQKCSGLI